MDLPAGGPRPCWEGAKPQNVSEAFSWKGGRLLRPAREPHEPRGGGGGGQGTCQQKTLGFRVSTFIPLPWEVPEGPACMVPVA